MAPAAGGPAPASAADAAKLLPRTAPCGIELTLEIEGDGARWGEAVPAKLTIVNRAPKALSLRDVAGDLARRLEMRIDHAGHLWCVTQGFVPGSLPAGDETTTLEPGRRAEFDVDLAGWLRRAPGYAPGRFRFVLAWRGNRGAVPESSGAWNSNDDNLATTREHTIDVAVPNWLAGLGADTDLLGHVENDLVRWTPGAPGADATTARLAAAGEPTLGALAFVATCAASPTAEADVRAGRAVRILREAGAPALRALRGAHHPATDMVADAIDADLREAADEPVAGSESAAAVGAATELQVSVHGREGQSPWLVCVDAAGRVLHVRDHGSPAESRTLRGLTADEIGTVRDALVTARPWTWRRLRTEGRPAEGTVSYAIVRDGRAVWKITLPGDEARRANPFAADVLAAAEHLAPETGTRVVAKQERP